MTMLIVMYLWFIYSQEELTETPLKQSEVLNILLQIVTLER